MRDPHPFRTIARYGSIWANFNAIVDSVSAAKIKKRAISSTGGMAGLLACGHGSGQGVFELLQLH
jgi:hypothetical protein